MPLDHASDQLRGRAMGVLTQAIGTAPFGTLEIGALTELLSPMLAVAVNTGAGAVWSR
jgi:hypothetical protein